MKTGLQKRCELFIENRDTIKSGFGWESAYIYPLCASIYAARGARADADTMKSCKDLLNKKTGLFSNFRGASKLATVTMLSLTQNPEQKMNQMLDVYGRLKEDFWGSEYLTVTASSIVDLADSSQYEEIAIKTREIYKSMKAAHPFLTSGEDSVYASLLALSGLDADYVAEEMERCYQILKPSFFSGNAVQSLSHILALGEGKAEEKCQRVMALFEYLKNHGHRYGTSYELSTLGVLALLETDIEVLANDIIEVDEFLKQQKGFGAFGVGSKQRLMYAGMLTMYEYVPQVQTMQMAALNGVVAIVIAQQAAICASVAATSAAVASSHSST